MSRFMNPAYAPLEAYVPGEQPRDKKYIKLNTNESPYPPAPAVAAAATRARLDDLRLYPDPDAGVLKEALAARYGFSGESIFMANGSDDILNFAFMAFGADGAAFADITYGFYRVFAALNHVKYDIIPLKEDFSLDHRDYLSLGKLILIANPNAPTGMAIPPYQIEEIVRSNPDSVVLVDEAYVDFGGESSAELVKKYENLLVVMTFSKSRSMAGARIGFAFGAPGLIADLEKLKYSTNPYNINRLSQFCGAAALASGDYYAEKCAAIAATRERTARELRALGFTVLPSRANFIFAGAPGKSGGELYEKLKARGILVRHFSGGRTDPFTRITIGTDAQMYALLAAVTDICK